jgi:hypothetical protein
MEVLCIGTADTKLEELLFLAARLRSGLAASDSAPEVPLHCAPVSFSRPLIHVGEEFTSLQSDFHLSA